MFLRVRGYVVCLHYMTIRVNFIRILCQYVCNVYNEVKIKQIYIICIFFILNIIIISYNNINLLLRNKITFRPCWFFFLQSTKTEMGRLSKMHSFTNFNCFSTKSRVGKKKHNKICILFTFVNQLIFISMRYIV